MIAAALATKDNILTFVGPMILLIIAGLFTLRSNVAKIWKDNYEAKVEEVKVLNKELEVSKDKAHELQTDLATSRQQLLIEQSKPDLTALVVQMEEHRKLLAQILEVLKKNNIGGTT